VEIARGEPAGTVVASRFPRVVAAARRAFGSPRLMVFRGDDVAGVELASALKNVVAVAAGMATEMGLGENARALLIARGLAEMTAVACAMGARPGTFAGLAGVGDLIATCSSRESRNHRVGAALARGARLEDALAALGMVAEGVPTTHAACELAARHRIEVPLFERVRRVLYEGLTPRAALDQLLALRPGRDVTWA
jgi:glycerol-3-phosphate dehydrogenase (NAD(P)+)